MVVQAWHLVSPAPLPFSLSLAIAHALALSSLLLPPPALLGCDRSCPAQLNFSIEMFKMIFSIGASAIGLYGQGLSKMGENYYYVLVCGSVLNTLADHTSSKVCGGQ